MVGRVKRLFCPISLKNQKVYLLDFDVEKLDFETFTPKLEMMMVMN